MDISNPQPPTPDNIYFSGWPFGDLQHKGYDFICADPPWRFKVYSRKTGLKKSADLHYTTMTMDEVKALPVRLLASKNCLLWLWCTSPMLRHGFDVLDAWGFEFSTQGQWAKRTKRGKLAFGTGFRLRSASEPFLLATRGNPKSTRSTRNLIEGLIREHSRKPDEAYAAMERMMPEARRADLFAREERHGWDSWGDEIKKFPKLITEVHNDRRASGRPHR